MFFFLLSVEWVRRRLVCCLVSVIVRLLLDLSSVASRSSVGEIDLGWEISAQVRTQLILPKQIRGFNCWKKFFSVKLILARHFRLNSLNLVLTVIVISFGTTSSNIVHARIVWMCFGYARVEVWEDAIANPFWPALSRNGKWYISSRCSYDALRFGILFCIYYTI